MANKSRRNRRAISSRPVANAGPSPIAAENKSAQSTVVKPAAVKTAPAKPTVVENFVTTHYFVRDLKWTGIVGVIIAALIIVALFVIPH